MLQHWSGDNTPMHGSAWFPRIPGNTGQPQADVISIWQVSTCAYDYTMYYKDNAGVNFRVGQLGATKICGDPDHTREYTVTFVSLTLEVWLTMCCSLSPSACSFMDLFVWCRFAQCLLDQALPVAGLTQCLLVWLVHVMC